MSNRHTQNTHVVTPTVDEVVDDVLALCEANKKPPSLQDWGEWYGVRPRLVLPVLVRAVGEERLATWKRRGAYDVWGDVDGRWRQAILKDHEAQMFQYLASKGRRVCAPMWKVGEELELSPDVAWCGIRRLMSVGLVKKVGQQETQPGRMSNVYEVLG